MEVQEMKDAISEELKAFKENANFVDKESQDKAINTLKEDLTAKFEAGASKEEVVELKEALQTMGETLSAMKLATPEKVKVGFSEEAVKDIQKALEDGKGNHVIEMKAAAAFTTANITSGTHLLTYEVDPNIYEAPREENVVFPSLLKGKTSGRTIYWANRINRDGGSAFIGEGVLKPLKDWEYAEENSVAKKVAVRASMSREILNDMPAFRQDVNTILRQDLLEEIEYQLINSTASSTALTGIIPVASGYTITEMDDSVSSPNDADAIRAAMLQMRLLNYKPDMVFMNPTEVALLDLTKDDNGQYIKLQIDGVLKNVKVVETANIAQGNFLLMDTRKWICKMLEDIRIEFGLNGDDFSKNMISVICEARLHSYYNSIDTGAFIYESFATVKSAIDSAI